MFKEEPTDEDFYREAGRLFLSITNGKPDQFKLQGSDSSDFESKEKLSKVIAILTSAIKIKEIPSYFFSRGKTYFLLHKNTEALSDISMAIRLATAPKYHLFRANVYRSLGLLLDASKDFQSAIDIWKDPEDSDFLQIHVDLGSVLMEISSYEDAFRVLSVASEKGEGEFEGRALFLRSICHRCHNERNMERERERVLSYEPSSYVHHYDDNFGEQFCGNSSYIPIEDLQSACLLLPSNYEAASELGLHFYLTKRFTEAIGAFTQAIDFVGIKMDSLKFYLLKDEHGIPMEEKKEMKLAKEGSHVLHSLEKNSDLLDLIIHISFLRGCCYKESQGSEYVPLCIEDISFCISLLRKRVIGIVISSEDKVNDDREIFLRLGRKIPKESFLLFIRGISFYRIFQDMIHFDTPINSLEYTEEKEKENGNSYIYFHRTSREDTLKSSLRDLRAAHEAEPLNPLFISSLSICLYSYSFLSSSSTEEEEAIKYWKYLIEYPSFPISFQSVARFHLCLLYYRRLSIKDLQLAGELIEQNVSYLLSSYQLSVEVTSDFTHLPFIINEPILYLHLYASISRDLGNLDLSLQFLKNGIEGLNNNNIIDGNDIGSVYLKKSEEEEEVTSLLTLIMDIDLTLQKKSIKIERMRIGDIYYILMDSSTPLYIFFRDRGTLEMKQHKFTEAVIDFKWCIEIGYHGSEVYGMLSLILFHEEMGERNNNNNNERINIIKKLINKSLDLLEEEEKESLVLRDPSQRLLLSWIRPMEVGEQKCSLHFMRGLCHVWTKDLLYAEKDFGIVYNILKEKRGSTLSINLLDNKEIIIKENIKKETETENTEDRMLNLHSHFPSIEIEIFTKEEEEEINKMDKRKELPFFLFLDPVDFSELLYRRGVSYFDLFRFLEAIDDFTECVTFSDNRIIRKIRNVMKIGEEINPNENPNENENQNEILLSDKRRISFNNQLTNDIKDFHADAFYHIALSQMYIDGNKNIKSAVRNIDVAICISYALLPLTEKPITSLTEEFSNEKNSVMYHLFPHYYHERAKALQTLGEHGSAIADFTIVLEMQPRNHHAYFRRGYSFKEMKMFVEASEDLETARELDPCQPVYKIEYTEVRKIDDIEICSLGKEDTVIY